MNERKLELKSAKQVRGTLHTALGMLVRAGTRAKKYLDKEEIETFGDAFHQLVDKHLLGKKTVLLSSRSRRLRPSGYDGQQNQRQRNIPMKVKKIAPEKDILGKFKTSEVTITTLETETEKQFNRNSLKIKSARGRFQWIEDGTTHTATSSILSQFQDRTTKTTLTRTFYFQALPNKSALETVEALENDSQLFDDVLTDAAKSPMYETFLDAWDAATSVLATSPHLVTFTGVVGYKNAQRKAA